MTKDEELEQLRQENSALRDQVARLSERISVLEAQLAKDSHNSHLPPSSDRFHRQPRSLRKKSGTQQPLACCEYVCIAVTQLLEELR